MSQAHMRLTEATVKLEEAQEFTGLAPIIKGLLFAETTALAALATAEYAAERDPAGDGSVR